MERCFLTAKEFLNHKFRPRFAKGFVFHKFADGGARLALVFGNDYTLPGGEAVGLDHNRVRRLCEHRVRFSGGGTLPEICRRNVIPFEKLLRVTLA